MSILETYINFCKKKGYECNYYQSVRSYNDSTLFCPAGMQQYKEDFSNEKICNKTITNIQSCLRVNDIDEIGDGTHLVFFDMLGLFSFRDKSLQWTIDFWIEFIQDILGLRIDYVTIHPDKIKEWSLLYEKYGLQIKEDKDCTWRDSEDSELSYCTEFYINDIEIGNIVNPSHFGNCIDAGFGLERLQSLVYGTNNNDKREILKKSIDRILLSGYKPGPKKQEYVLRKLLRAFHNMGGVYEENDSNYHIFIEEKQRNDKLFKKYLRLKDKFQNKDKEWWFSTHGIDLDLMEN